MSSKKLTMSITDQQPTYTLHYKLQIMFGVSIREMVLEKHCDYLRHLTIVNVVIKLLLLLIIVVLIAYCAQCKIGLVKMTHL